MPSDAGAGLIFDHQRVFEQRGMETGEFRRTLSKRRQKVGQLASLLQSTPIEVIMPTEGDGAALTEEAVEFEFLEGERG